MLRRGERESVASAWPRGSRSSYQIYLAAAPSTQMKRYCDYLMDGAAAPARSLAPTLTTAEPMASSRFLRRVNRSLG